VLARIHALSSHPLYGVLRRTFATDTFPEVDECDRWVFENLYAVLTHAAGDRLLRFRVRPVGDDGYHMQCFGLTPVQLYPTLVSVWACVHSRVRNVVFAARADIPSHDTKPRMTGAIVIDVRREHTPVTALLSPIPETSPRTRVAELGAASSARAMAARGNGVNGVNNGSDSADDFPGVASPIDRANLAAVSQAARKRIQGAQIAFQTFDGYYVLRVHSFAPAEWNSLMAVWRARRDAVFDMEVRFGMASESGSGGIFVYIHRRRVFSGATAASAAISPTNPIGAPRKRARVSSGTLQP
jgi:hypothetical protein